MDSRRDDNPDSISVSASEMPTVIDRLVSINAITGKASVVPLLLAFISKEFGFIDVAVVFMLCGFVSSLWILKALVPKFGTSKLASLTALSIMEREIN